MKLGAINHHLRYTVNSIQRNNGNSIKPSLTNNLNIQKPGNYTQKIGSSMVPFGGYLHGIPGCKLGNTGCYADETYGPVTPILDHEPPSPEDLYLEHKRASEIRAMARMRARNECLYAFAKLRRDVNEILKYNEKERKRVDKDFEEVWNKFDQVNITFLDEFAIMSMVETRLSQVEEILYGPVTEKKEPKVITLSEKAVSLLKKFSGDDDIKSEITPDELMRILKKETRNAIEPGRHWKDVHVIQNVANRMLRKMRSEDFDSHVFYNMVKDLSPEHRCELLQLSENLAFGQFEDGLFGLTVAHNLINQHPTSVYGQENTTNCEYPQEGLTPDIVKLMDGFSNEQIYRILSIKENFSIANALALDWPDEFESLFNKLLPSQQIALRKIMAKDTSYWYGPNSPRNRKDSDDDKKEINNYY